MTEKKASEVSGIPAFDLGELLRQFQLPGVDVSQLIENERKNIEAVQQANQAVAEGWQALAEKQSEIFRETMERWQALASETPATDPQEAMTRQAELAREGFEQALANMRSLAEIAAESQSKAFEAISKRMEENIKQMFEATSPKS